MHKKLGKGKLKNGGDDNYQIRSYRIGFDNTFPLEEKRNFTVFGEIPQITRGKHLRLFVSTTDGRIHWIPLRGEDILHTGRK